MPERPPPPPPAPQDLPPRPIEASPPAGKPPFQRLLLVANNIMEAKLLIEAAKPGVVGAILYDWYAWQPEDVLSAAKKAVGGSAGRVSSIAVVAAGSAGCVRVLKSADWQLDSAERLSPDGITFAAGALPFPSSHTVFRENVATINPLHSNQTENTYMLAGLGGMISGGVKGGQGRIDLISSRVAENYDGESLFPRHLALPVAAKNPCPYERGL